MNGKVTQYKVGDRVKIADGFHSGKQAEIIKIQNNDQIRVRYDGNLFMVGFYRSDQIAPIVPSTDDIIPPKQAEAQPPAAMPEYPDRSRLSTREEMDATLADKRAEIATAPEKPYNYDEDLRAWREWCDKRYPPEVTNEQTELETLRAQLDAARAEITKLQADVVTLTTANQEAKLMITALQAQKAELTVDNRRLREAGKKLLYAHDVQFGIANPDQFPPGTSEYCLDEERLEAAKVFNSEVNS